MLFVNSTNFCLLGVVAFCAILLSGFHHHFNFNDLTKLQKDVRLNSFGYASAFSQHRHPMKMKFWMLCVSYLAYFVSFLIVVVVVGMHSVKPEKT